MFLLSRNKLPPWTAVFDMSFFRSITKEYPKSVLKPEFYVVYLPEKRTGRGQGLLPEAKDRYPDGMSAGRNIWKMINR